MSQLAQSLVFSVPGPAVSCNTARSCAAAGDEMAAYSSLRDPRQPYGHHFKGTVFLEAFTGVQQPFSLQGTIP